MRTEEVKIAYREVKIAYSWRGAHVAIRGTRCHLNEDDRQGDHGHFIQQEKKCDSQEQGLSSEKMLT